MMFETHIADQLQTGWYGKLYSDYISKSGNANRFYNHFPDLDGFNSALSEIKKHKFNREQIADAIALQYSNLGLLDEKRASQISSLKDNNVYTVCTGHQLCLFTGPLYFIYKIASTIHLAGTLSKQFPDCRFVPVFWLASEDHDADEIKNTFVYNKEIAWNTDQKGAVGLYSTDGIGLALAKLTELLGENDIHTKELMMLLADAYTHSDNLAVAVFKIVHRLFSDYGLLCVDANDKKLKKLFSDKIACDLFENKYKRITEEVNKELSDCGYSIQAHPREINLFYLNDQMRERIVFEENKFKVLNTNLSFDKDEIRSEIDLHPERFSPNAILRPLYQQVLLPNIAYVGGPGELSYWLQLKNMFSEENVFFPVLTPRASFIQVDSKTAQSMSSLGIEKRDVFKKKEELVKEFVSRTEKLFTVQSEKIEIEKMYETIKQKLELIDKTLLPAADAELKKSIGGLDNIEGKANRSLKRKHENEIHKIEKLFDKFYPGNIPQERYENFSAYYAKYGKAWIDYIISEADPLRFSVNIMLETTG